MIDRDFAERFINEISALTQYQFIVFNRKGIILAATEKKREGAFHQAAYNMMQQNLDMVTIRPEDVKNYIGVRTGMNVTVYYNHKMIGAIGITGNPEDVQPVIMVAKMTFEKMFENEMFIKQTLQNNDKWEAFYGLLLDCEPKNAGKLNQMARNLELSADILRIPLVFKTAFNQEDIVLSAIRTSSHYRPQDIAFIAQKETVVVFKSIDKPAKLLFKEYRKTIFEFINPIFDTLKQKDVPCDFYAGTFQETFTNYYFAFRHCMWLVENAVPNSFFADYVDDYIRTIIPLQELYGIYDAVGSMMDEKMQRDFYELFTVLKKCNYNLVDSSEQLNIHKNTLVFRLNKYKEYFNINPVHDSEDRAFADYLCNYFQRIF